MALNLTIDAFCRLVKQHANIAQLVTMYEPALLYISIFSRVFTLAS